MNEVSQLLVNRWTEVAPFLLVVARTSAVVVGAPFWGGASSPKLVRIVVAMSLSAAVYPFAPVMSASVEAGGLSLVTLLLALGKEVLIGLAIGWSAQLLFAAMRMAGQQIEMKIGLGLTQLIDPHNGGQTSLIPAVLDLVASLVFLSVNGHHLLVQSLVSSYQVFPLTLGTGVTQANAGAAGIATLEVLHYLMRSTGEIFPIALRVSAPVLIGALLADVVLGIISRVAPQLNLFAVVLPAQFAFGLLLLFLALPLIVWFCVDQLTTTNHQFSALFFMGRR
jgi:flagellar biosynthetic protein FliR